MRQFRCKTVQSAFQNNKFVMLDDKGRHRASLFTDHAHRPVFCLQGEDANEQITLETTEKDEPKVFVSLGGHDGIPHVEVRSDDGVMYESQPISGRQANE